MRSGRDGEINDHMTIPSVSPSRSPKLSVDDISVDDIERLRVVEKRGALLNDPVVLVVVVVVVLKELKYKGRSECSKI